MLNTYYSGRGFQPVFSRECRVNVSKDASVAAFEPLHIYHLLSFSCFHQRCLLSAVETALSHISTQADTYMDGSDGQP
jgi:hypothetical protein